MQQRGFFITGTDTGVGKTSVAIALLHWLNQQGYQTAALKPLESGCTKRDGQLYGEDGLQLQQTCSVPLTYQQINPIALELAIAPHIAAEKMGLSLTVEKLLQASQPVLNTASDYLIVEGAGGWHMPLNADETIADFAVKLNLPVLLVVGLRLGCLNHARLTLEAIENKGLSCVGWVANILSLEMSAVAENIVALQQQLSIPHLATLEYAQSLASVDFSLITQAYVT